MSDLQTIQLPMGVSMPTNHFGCAFGDWVGKTDFQGFLPEQAWEALSLALDNGYRAFDGAHVYQTEGILGALLGHRFARGELKREELFITTKLAHPNAPPHVNLSHLRTWDADAVEDVAQRVRDDFAKSLDELHLGYVDLTLIHWPGPFANQDLDLARAARKTIWETFGELLERGATRAIGVSNFSVEHLRQLAEDAPGAKPAVNQVELHPYCRDPELETYCQKEGIALVAYAPFASGAFGLLEDPTLVEIAAAHGVGVGQVVLRWHLQSGRAALPKTSKAARMRSNQDLFGFALDEAQMAAIDALGAGEPRRTCPDPREVI